MRNCCHGEVGHETVLSVLDGRHRHALDRARSSEIRECTEICQSARYCFCFFSTVSVGGGVDLRAGYYRLFAWPSVY